ncbi:hypothetical protein BLA23254_05464 [Burkholderia lata]|uniref:Lipoprotein n=2 Tax=Burkholderia lata (strain ATCC 17760 / DSM 23089 / LMG 22485 / NCIMB 9086 / R18194 / 383) TaxID=482957 RepID=A0A6P2PZF5_BURL3|nr:hypothetical protein BLA23254_05464 [Burkholderia lata]VWD15278.1 hypothetical protein BLA39750_03508 [Burkholderia lata]
MMKTKTCYTLVASLLLGASLSGCVVAPAEPPAVAPAGVVYVAPVGVMPAPGYSWRYHPHYGWGWWHPHYGWHRGWR